MHCDVCIVTCEILLKCQPLPEDTGRFAVYRSFENLSDINLALMIDWRLGQQKWHYVHTLVSLRMENTNLSTVLHSFGLCAFFCLYKPSVFCHTYTGFTLDSEQIYKVSYSARKTPLTKKETLAQTTATRKGEESDVPE